MSLYFPKILRRDFEIQISIKKVKKYRFSSSGWEC